MRVTPCFQVAIWNYVLLLVLGHNTYSPVRLRWPQFVDFPQYLFRPRNGVRYGVDGGGHVRASFVRRQLPRSKDTGRYQEHALASFIHSAILSVSCFVRYPRLVSRRGQSNMAATKDKSKMEAQAEHLR
jgi:hypothetical protein